jgi:hypothetical protein
MAGNSESLKHVVTARFVKLGSCGIFHLRTRNVTVFDNEHVLWTHRMTQNKLIPKGGVWLTLIFHQYTDRSAFIRWQW